MAIYPLRNPVQNYPWGSTSDIPDLLGRANPQNEPVAELWLGAHPKALALQVHPTKARAENGFERESDLGIRPGAPQRNYLDRNHKPELICALGPFDCLAGFRSVEEIAAAVRIGQSMQPGLQARLVREVVVKAVASRGNRYQWIVETIVLSNPSIRWRWKGALTITRFLCWISACSGSAWRGDAVQGHGVDFQPALP